MSSPEPTPRGRSLSDQLQQVEWRVGNEPMRLQELLQKFQGRSCNLLIILLALPFLIPIPIPFLSTPLGAVILLAGIQIALRRRTQLPERFGRHLLPAGFLRQVIAAAGYVTRLLERLAKPRWIAARHLRGFHRTNGILIACAGGLLLLPIPVPLTNLFPACAILCLATAGIQRDGLCFLCGCVFIGISLAFFATLAFGGHELLQSFIGGSKPLS